ncbi:hypothetical protein Tco_1314182 [Tanacetum coccineum]
MNGWIKEEEEEEDPEMEEEEDLEEDPEMEEEELRQHLYQPPPFMLHHEPDLGAATVGTGRLVPLTRLFTNTQVWTGSSSSSVVVSHDPEDLTPSHIRSDLEVLQRRVRQIEKDDVLHKQRLRYTHLPPHLHYQEAPYVLPSALMVPVTHDDPRDPYVAAHDAATAPATDNDDPAAREETSSIVPQGSQPSVNS